MESARLIRNIFWNIVPPSASSTRTSLPAVPALLTAMMHRKMLRKTLRKNLQQLLHSRCHECIKQTRLLLGVAKCKESTPQRVNSICCHACIRTHLLLSVAKSKESTTRGTSSMCYECTQEPKRSTPAPTLWRNQKWKKGTVWHRAQHTTHQTSTQHTGEQEPRGPAHRTRKTTHATRTHR